MVNESLTTQQKALQINLDAGKFGTFAEIGAGQEVVRWFFHVGKAAATVAKSISAYDTVVSDEIYGATTHYVSRTRIEAMLDYEYPLLIQRLSQKRGDKDCFFVFADTVATHGRRGTTGGHGWLGIRFQAHPRHGPSQILLHVQLLESVTTGEQDALGILGVNLIYGAFYYNTDPSRLVRSLTDGLRRDHVANRLALDPAANHVIRLGHSSHLLKLRGKYWLIDPVFGERASPFSFAGPKRFHPPPLALTDLPPIEGLILSHDHYDHLDVPTIDYLRERVQRYFVPLGVAARLQQMGVAAGRVAEFDWWQSGRHGEVELTAAPAQHFSGRTLWDRDRTLWASWIIQSGSERSPSRR